MGDQKPATEQWAALRFVLLVALLVVYSTEHACASRQQFKQLNERLDRIEQLIKR